MTHVSKNGGVVVIYKYSRGIKSLPHRTFLKKRVHWKLVGGSLRETVHGILERRWSVGNHIKWLIAST